VFLALLAGKSPLLKRLRKEIARIREEITPLDENSENGSNRIFFKKVSEIS